MNQRSNESNQSFVCKEVHVSLYHLMSNAWHITEHALTVYIHLLTIYTTAEDSNRKFQRVTLKQSRM